VAQQPAVKEADKPEPQVPATRPQPPATPAQPQAAPKQPEHAPIPAPNQEPQQQDTPAGAPAPAAAAQAQVTAANSQLPTANSPSPPQAAPVQPAPQAPAVTAPPAPAAPAPPPGARLAQAVETVHQVIRISQSNGITQARVQLHPEELGSIDIHLRSTPDGVVARVVADASQAAAVLRDGGDELRRQLASQGINLTHFDVGTTGQERREAAFGNGGSSQQRGNHSANSEDADAGAASPDNTDETTITLPNGVLIDVLA
jgi:flagellar hook-length control protein FliK